SSGTTIGCPRVTGANASCSSRATSAGSAPRRRFSSRCSRIASSSSPIAHSLTRLHHLDFPKRAPPTGVHGAIAQLGERLDRTQEVGGSSPPSSTSAEALHVRASGVWGIGGDP